MNESVLHLARVLAENGISEHPNGKLETEAMKTHVSRATAKFDKFR